MMNKTWELYKSATESGGGILDLHYLAPANM